MSFTKVAPAGIGTEPGDGYRIGNSFLHAAGLQMGIWYHTQATEGGTVLHIMVTDQTSQVWSQSDTPLGNSALQQLSFMKQIMQQQYLQQLL